jgi:type III restriction enzyme
MSALNEGQLKKLDGMVLEWGHRAIGVFQTSDDRHDDRRNLGIHSTWVKWAEPTAEALRQACLARQTRLHQTEPQLPAITITSLEISNSTFLGPIDLELNPQFTCLIGGRGTGKSSILEYLRWALCDHPPQTDSAELPDYQRKRVGLVKNTLAKVDGIVTVTFSLNGIQHVVQRKSTEDTIQLKIGDGDFEDRTTTDIEKLLPIQAYSQKQLSAVGVRTEELVRLVESPVEITLSALRDKARDVQERIRKTYNRLRGVRDLTSRLKQHKVEESSLALQVEELRKQLTGLSDDDRAILNQHEHVLAEERYVEQLTRNVETTRTAIQELADSIVAPPDPPASDNAEEPLPHAATLTNLSTAVRGTYASISQRMDELVELFVEGGDATKDFVAAEKTVRNAIAEHTSAYEEAKTRSSAHSGKLKQIEELEKRIKGIRQTITETEENLRKLGEPGTEYETLMAEWIQTYAERADLLRHECEKLTGLSDGRIRATLAAAADTGRLQERLSAEMTGTRVRGTAIEALCKCISESTDPAVEWTEVAREFESLAIIEAEENDDVLVPACPRLGKAGVTQNDLERIARKLKPTTWLELSLTQLDDVPIFEYQRRENDYIPFASASAGQQATALLQVLLNQDGPPLIIDQPEDDLDNQVIYDIVEQLWSARSRRQIIVSSHNANLVVNGDADLVICCDYRRSGDHSGGQIKCRGAIDIEKIREEIKRIMEGGEKAFQLRKAKYGF